MRLGHIERSECEGGRERVTPGDGAFEDPARANGCAKRGEQRERSFERRARSASSNEAPGQPESEEPTEPQAERGDERAAQREAAERDPSEQSRKSRRNEPLETDR